MLLRFKRITGRRICYPDQLGLPKFLVPVCSSYRYANPKFVRNMTPATEADVRCFKNNGVFKLTFSVGTADRGTLKSLYFERKLEEPLENLLQRISSKINAPSKRKKKNQTTEAPSGNSDLAINFLKKGVSLPGEVICSELFQEADNRDLVLKIGEAEFTVYINRPWIEKMHLPKVLLAGHPAYPYKYEMHFAVEDDCEFLWYKQKDRDWNASGEYVGSGFLYVPTVQDVGSHLKLLCTPKRGSVIGEAVQVISDSLVEAGPGQNFTDIRHSFTRDALTGDSFRVVSYNILADLYASSSAGRTELFTYCPEYARSMHYRKLLLLRELIGYNADVICLQEVDFSLFKRELSQILGTIGFEGDFAKKGGEVNEGAACFYKKSRLRLVENHSSVLSDEAMREKEYWKSTWNNISSNAELLNFMIKLKNTVQVLVFEYVEKSNRKLIVANTHLYFRPNADVIRILQAALCLQLVNHVKEAIQKREPDSTTSVIFCGDFNSTPECGVYQLFTKNLLPKDYHEWKTAPSEFKTDGLELRNRINFESACGIPECTNFAPDFQECIDYIFYDADHLQVEEVLPFPSKEELSEHIAIPSIVFPSDHIALVANLKWKE